MANQGALIGRALSASYDSSPVLIPPIDNDWNDGLYFFQGVEAEASRNRAPGGVGSFLTKVGNPLFQGAYMSFVPASDFWQSEHAEVDTYTAFSVWRSSASFVGGANQPSLFGNFAGSTGTSMYVTNHSTLPAPASRFRNNFYTTGGGGNNQASVNITDSTLWACCFSRVSATAGRVDDKTHGFGADAVAPTGTRVLDLTRKMRFGSSFSGSILGPHDQAAAGYFPGRWFTDAQVTALYNFVKNYLAQPGIAIIV